MQKFFRCIRRPLALQGQRNLHTWSSGSFESCSRPGWPDEFEKNSPKMYLAQHNRRKFAQSGHPARGISNQRPDRGCLIFIDAIYQNVKIIYQLNIKLPNGPKNGHNMFRWAISETTFFPQGPPKFTQICIHIWVENTPSGNPVPDKVSFWEPHSSFHVRCQAATQLLFYHT
jgi:hypothetical protein